MRLCWKEMFLPLRLENASSMVQPTEQWSMMVLSQPAAPSPSRVTVFPFLSRYFPSRRRMKRKMPSEPKPKGCSRRRIPLPGAVCPATVMNGSEQTRRSFRSMMPATSKTMVRGPLTFVIPYRREPGCGFSGLSSKEVT